MSQKHIKGIISEEYYKNYYEINKAKYAARGKNAYDKVKKMKADQTPTLRLEKVIDLELIDRILQELNDAGIDIVDQKKLKKLKQQTI